MSGGRKTYRRNGRKRNITKSRKRNSTKSRRGGSPGFTAYKDKNWDFSMFSWLLHAIVTYLWKKIQDYCIIFFEFTWNLRLIQI